jgi:hypothetical protein
MIWAGTSPRIPPPYVNRALVDFWGEDGALLMEYQCWGITIYLNYKGNQRKSQLALQQKGRKMAVLLKKSKKKPGHMTRRVEQGGFTSGRRRIPEDPNRHRNVDGGFIYRDDSRELEVIMQCSYDIYAYLVPTDSQGWEFGL